MTLAIYKFTFPLKGLSYVYMLQYSNSCPAIHIPLSCLPENCRPTTISSKGLSDTLAGIRCPVLTDHNLTKRSVPAKQMSVLL